VPSRHWQNRIRDILSAISEIQSFTEGLTFEDFQNDRKTIGAVLYTADSNLKCNTLSQSRCQPSRS